LLIANEPTDSAPTVRAAPVATQQLTSWLLLAFIVVLVPFTVPVVATPLMLMEQALAATLLVPVFVSSTLQLSPPVLSWWHNWTWAETCAELVNDPNRPNTNPAMAMAAMRVMAIRITVARTGEIAFLRLGLFILKWLLPAYDQTPENGTDAPLLIENEPTA